MERIGRDEALSASEVSGVYRGPRGVSWRQWGLMYAEAFEVVVREY